MSRPVKDHSARVWYRGDAIHRTNGPAIEFYMGTKIWYHQGICHRLYSPAIEWRDGRLSWYVWGKQYRERSIGIPDMISPIRLGNQRVWLDEHTLLNRYNGPAKEYDDGRKQWYRHGFEMLGRFDDRMKPVL